MIQSIPKTLTFDEFIARYPEDGRYELIDGQIVEMRPTGKHRDSERIESLTFPELNLTVSEIFEDRE